MSSPVIRSNRVLVLIPSLLFMSTAAMGQNTGAPPALVSTSLVGEVVTHTVAAGETLVALGARSGIEASVIARRNGRPAGRPLAVGDELLLDNRHIVPAAASASEVITINIPQRLLFSRRGDQVEAWYPVGLGRPTWQTPLGSFTILDKETDPTWDVPISIQDEMRREGKPVILKMPPCPVNPLGRYWIRLSHRGVGIHGTNAPTSIYQFRTHGCIRLHPDDVCALFPRVSVGDRGRTLYEPVLLAALPDGRVFVEIHRDVYRRGPEPLRYLRRLADQAGLSARIEWDRVDAAIRLREGLAVEVARPATTPVSSR